MMKMRLMKCVGAAMLTLSLGLATTPADAKPKKQPAIELTQLTQQGEQLEQQYAAELARLKAELTVAVPEVSDSVKQAYQGAVDAEAKAKADLAAAQKALGDIGGKKGLIGHAKNHWIPKADRGIKAAQDKLAKAKTDAERQAAEKELKQWQDNRQAGLDALKERTAAYEAAMRDEPKLKKQVEQAKDQLVESQQRVMAYLDGLKIEAFLKSDKLDAQLAKFVVLNEATPRGLAAFAQQGAEHRQLVDKLLADDQLMITMAWAGGAEGGNYGRAMQIYTDILGASPKAKDGIFNRLALATALEHATPIKQTNPEAATNAPQFVDPVARYMSYEQAYLNKELDPYFDTHDAWELRFVVNGDEPDETAAWGRDMLRNYHPDHITTKDDRWRYVALVRTCIRYGSEENKYDKPELHKYQNILMNGGICGRRAFIGRFILRSFGVPTVAKPQKGHAALGRWTPDGWVAVLGAGWNTGWAPSREMAAIDFLALTQARETDSYMQVLRAYWIGEVNAETRVPGLNSGKNKPEFWNSVALNTQREIIDKAGTKALAAVGEELGEANESKVKYPFESAEITDADRKIQVDNKGVITIPAAATTSPTKSSGKVQFLDSVLGGKQLTYNRTGNNQDFTYTVDAPKAGTYDLSMLVATPSWKQHLQLTVNSGKPVVIELPHTVGLWEQTQPIKVELVKGKNTLTFSRNGIQQEVAEKGFAIKQYTLTPVSTQN